MRFSWDKVCILLTFYPSASCKKHIKTSFYQHRLFPPAHIWSACHAGWPCQRILCHPWAYSAFFQLQVWNINLAWTISLIFCFFDFSPVELFAMLCKNKNKTPCFKCLLNKQKWISERINEPSKEFIRKLHFHYSALSWLHKPPQAASLGAFSSMSHGFHHVPLSVVETAF